MNCEWRQVPGFSRYMVSDYGCVESHCGKKPRILTPSELPSGYLFFRLRDDAGTRYYTMYAHRLVLSTFVGEPGEGQVCRHLDGNPHNNCIENLAWGSPLENGADRVRHGTSLRGEKHNMVKLNWADVNYIRNHPVYTGSQRKLAKELGVSTSTISLIVRGDIWRDNDSSVQ